MQQPLWSRNNPHWFREHNFQEKFTINVWCGLVHGHLIGPHFYEQNLTAAQYLQFHRNKLGNLLQVVSNDVKHNLYFQQDG